MPVQTTLDELIFLLTISTPTVFGMQPAVSCSLPYSYVFWHLENLQVLIFCTFSMAAF